jgi:hypothetical protein
LPTRNARIGDENQEQPTAARYDIDDPKGFEKFVNAFSAILTMLESPVDRAAAAGKTVFFLKSHGLRWLDIVEGWNKHRRGDDGDAAQATITHLLTQIAALQAEIDQLRAERDTGNQISIWAEAGIKPSETARVARWALDLHARQYCGISIKEVEFLQHMTRWSGRQTPKQEEWFRDIIGGVVRRTGQTPPTS